MEPCNKPQDVAGRSVAVMSIATGVVGRSRHPSSWQGWKRKVHSPIKAEVRLSPDDAELGSKSFESQPTFDGSARLAASQVFPFDLQSVSSDPSYFPAPLTRTTFAKASNRLLRVRPTNRSGFDRDSKRRVFNMSFGFAIGDFIATGELCWKIYRQVYEVSKGASAEVQALHKELSNMSNVIRALVEDVKEPNSAVAQAGSDRIQLTNDIMERTMETLGNLQNLLKKYDLLRSPSNGGGRKLSTLIRRNWDKIKYTKEVRTINDLRSKLSYQNGLLTLVLIAGNNSSLERIKSQNEKLLRCVGEIKAFIFGASQRANAPLIDGPFDQQFQYELTRGMMAKAEVNGRAWSSIGIDDWIQAGKWWLMKAQARLYSAKPGTPESCQAYADLLKASWILTDIIAAHPQMILVSNGSQQVEIQHLSNAIKAEHEKVERHLPGKPQPQQIIKANLSIWNPISTTSLMPSLHPMQAKQQSLWKTESGEILYQRFGIYLSRSTCLEIECIIILEANADDRALNIIAQTSEGQEMLRHDALKWKVPFDLSMSSSQNELYSITFVPTPTQGDKGDTETLFFFSFEDARVFNLLLWQVPLFQSKFPSSNFDVRTLRGGALFQYLYLLQEEGRQFSEPEANEDILRLSEESTDSINEEDLCDLWNLATHASKLSGRAPSFEDPRRKHETPMSLLSVVCWASPAAFCSLAALDSIAPKGSEGYTQYVGELVQAAIYRQDETFLVGALELLGVHPQSVGKLHSGPTDAFVEILLRYLGPLNELVGVYILLWTSLQRKHIGLLNAIVELKPGTTLSYGDLLKETLEDAFVNRDLEVCRVLSNISKPINQNSHLHELLLRAISLRFPEGVKYAVSIYRGRPDPQWTIPALLTFDPDVIRYMKEHNCLAPNVDLYVRSARGFTTRRRYHYAYFSSESESLNAPISIFHKRLHIYGKMENGEPHLPLRVAIYLGCDLSIITDLISVGALVMRKCFPPETLPQVIRHVQECVSVEDARRAFFQTLGRTKRVLGASREQLKDAIDGLLSLLVEERLKSYLLAFDTANTLIGVNPEEKNPFVTEEGPVGGYSITGDDELELDRESVEYTTVALPKSLETQATWTKWREEVYPILEKALKCQFPREEGESSEIEKFE